jgi:hypothetical protein
MKDLLTISNNVAIPSAYILTIPEFETLTSKELAFVYFYTDHKSPYSFYENGERKIKLEEDLKVKVNAKIQAAIKKYEELSETHAIRLLKAARISVHKLEKYFKEIDLTATDDNGKLLFSAKDLVANLKNVGDVVEGLNTLEELIIKDAAKDSPNRSGVQSTKYNS